MYLGPVLVTFAVGAALIALFFIPHHAAQAVNGQILEWATILYAFALILGSTSLWSTHARKVRNRSEGWPYSLVTMFTLVTVTGLGVLFGIREGTAVHAIYETVNAPLASTMFALLAFFIASAAFRAFRIRSPEAMLLAIAAFILMLGRVPLGNAIHPFLPAAADWLMEVPQNAAKRGILIGAALGVIATGMRVILGMEKTYGGGESSS